jgi:hypothetical protein
MELPPGQAQALANRIRQHPWVTVTGPSGSGKSSLLHAGVQPRLTDFRVLTLRPGPAPLATLSTRLLTALEDRAQAEQLAEVARANPGELGIALARACLASGSRLLLLVDQAEELLTLCTDSAQREAFARALASAAADASGPVRVVLSLREDFFGRMATLAPRRGLYTRQVEVVTAIEKEGLVAAKHGRTRRVLRQLTVGTIGFLGLFLLTDKLMQYAGLSQLAGDTLKVLMGIVLVPLTWLLLRRTRAERLSPRPRPAAHS